LLALLLVAAPAAADDLSGYRFEAGAGASGGTALFLPNGDLLNVRNVQGGMESDPNLDIGAGSAGHPGDVSLNWDVGRCTKVWNGRKELIASFCPERVVFHVPVEFKQRVRARQAIRPR